MLAQSSPQLLIQHANVVDVFDGRILPDISVEIRGSLIERIGSNIEAEPGGIVVDASGKFLIPGLWDMNVRLREADTSFHALITHGIASVRAMYSGVPVAEYEAWRLHPDAVRIAAGGLIQGVVDSDTAKLAVRVIAANRADFVQVSNDLSRDAYFAVADETRRRGTSFAGVVPESVRLAEASKAAQLSVEGIGEILRECPENCEVLLETLADNGTFVTPLLAVSQYRGSPDRQLIQQMKQAGIHILAGSGWSNESENKLGEGLHEELKRLVDSGLTPLEALQAVTRNPALYFGTLTLMGTIEKGKAADLVLLDENPLEDIRNTRKIRAVWVRGKYYSREALGVATYPPPTNHTTSN